MTNKIPLCFGQQVPDIELLADDGSPFRLNSLRGERVLIVFYPGDNTPVCTAQLCDYRDGMAQFAELKVKVIGISKDDVPSHARFKKKYNLPFPLLSDVDGSVAIAYGVRGLYGNRRAVFLIDEEGRLRYAKVETISLFRRRRSQLLQIIKTLDQGTAMA